MKKNKFIKYLSISFISLVLLWLISIAIVYLFLDVNKLKDIAINKINTQSKGELKVGDIKFKVFPSIYFEINDIVLKSSKEFNNSELFNSKKAKLSFNFLKLLFAKPSLSLAIINPNINVISDGLTNNIETLFEIEKDKESSELNLDFINYLFFTNILFEIKNANISYFEKEELINIKDLNINLTINALKKIINFDLIAPIDFKKEDLLVNGILNLNINAKIKEKLDLNINLDASKLKISKSEFSKNSNDTLKIVSNITSDLKNELIVDNLDLYLFSKLLSINGKINDFNKPKIDLKINSTNYDLKNLSKLSHDFKNIAGTFFLDLSLTGFLPLKDTNEKLNLTLNLDAKETIIKSASFNKNKATNLNINLNSTLNSKNINNIDFKFNFAELTSNLSGNILKIDTDKPELDLNFTLNKFNLNTLKEFFPAHIKPNGYIYSNLKLKGAIIPKIDFEFAFNDDTNKNDLKINFNNKENLFLLKVLSKKLNIDDYISFPQSELNKTTKNENVDSNKAEENIELFNKEGLDKLKITIGAYSLNIDSKLNNIIANKLEINNFNIEALFNKDEFNFKNLSFNTLNGNFNSNFNLNIKNTPNINASFNLKNLNLKDLVSYLMPNLSGVIDGKISSKLKLNTRGYFSNELKKNLIADGDFYFTKFRYSAFDLNNLINDAISEKIGKDSNRKILGSNPGWDTVEGIYNIKNEIIYIEKLLAKESKYEAKAIGHITFKETLDLYIDFKVPYSNIPYEPLKINDQSQILVHLSGPVLKPKFDTEYLLKFLANKIIEHEKNKLKDKVKEQSKTIKKEIKTKADDELKKAKDKAKEDLKRKFRF